jgi:hypothetical protein
MVAFDRNPRQRQHDRVQLFGNDFSARRFALPVCALAYCCRIFEREVRRPNLPANESPKFPPCSVAHFLPLGFFRRIVGCSTANLIFQYSSRAACDREHPMRTASGQVTAR